MIKYFFKERNTNTKFSSLVISDGKSETVFIFYGDTEAWDRKTHRYILQVTFNGLFLELHHGSISVHYFINK